MSSSTPCDFRDSLTCTPLGTVHLYTGYVKMDIPIGGEHIRQGAILLPTVFTETPHVTCSFHVVGTPPTRP